MLAPASKAALLKNLSGAHLRWLWSTLTSILFGQKVFRLFARKVIAVQYRKKSRQGRRRGTVCLSYFAGFCKFCPLRCSRETGDARRVGYIGEGGSGAGATSLSASPMPRSLVTFLAGQESNITAPIKKPPLQGYRSGLFYRTLKPVSVASKAEP